MNNNIIKVIINKEQEKNRIDKILMENNIIKNLNITRGQLQNIIKNGNLKKNNQTFIDNSYKAKLNDNFELLIPEIKEKTLQATEIPLNIVYEDNDLIVINKQAGLGRIAAQMKQQEVEYDHHHAGRHLAHQ